jgi:hypothetical protein
MADFNMAARDLKPGERDTARRKAQNHFVVHEERTQLVKAMVAEENAASDAKTAKLRALRLAKEEADRQAALDAPPPAPKAKTPRAKVIKV